MTIEKKKNKIIFNRTFSAPINKVFDAYTKRELFEQWFHPQDASVTVYNFNATKGGSAFYAIQAPQMTSYTIAEYLQVDAPYYIEYLDYFANSKGEKDTSMPGMHITLNFEEVKGKTTVTSTSTFPTESAAQQAIDMGVETGMNSTLNQLEKLLNQK